MRLKMIVMEKNEIWMSVAVCDSTGLERNISSEDESGEKKVAERKSMIEKEFRLKLLAP